MNELIHLFLTLLLFLIPILAIIYVSFSLVTEFLGAPFVPTSDKIIDGILKKAKLKKGQVFLELGSGDGRVLQKAVGDFEVSGVGVELNWLLVLYARIWAKLKGVNIEFRMENFYNTDLKKADTIFVFLLPKTLKKLSSRFLKECKKNVLIISHGFKIAGFERYLVDKIDRDLYPTYYYKLPRTKVRGFPSSLQNCKKTPT